MKSINLKHAGTRRLSQQEISKIIDKYEEHTVPFDSAGFEALISLAEESSEPYRNLLDELSCAINALKASPRDEDDENTNYMLESMKESLVSRRELFSSIFEELSKEGIADFNKLYRLSREDETRIYLQHAIEESDTTYTDMSCAEVADNLLDESEAVYALYHAAITRYMVRNVFEDVLEQSIRNSNLSELKKEKLCQLLRAQINFLA